MENLASNREAIIRTAPRSSVLSYSNDDVIYKFCDEWSVDKDQASDVFQETLKFLFLAGKCKEDCFHLQIDTPILIIDKMWHTFILFTEDYA